MTERTDELIAEFELSAAALELYDFFWSELCDWYLEMAKARLRDGDEAVSATLLYALDRTLRLLHPLMPHVTEEIWSFMPGERGLLTVAPWPEADPDRAATRPRGRGRQRDRRDHRRPPLPRPGRGQALGRAARAPGADAGRRAGRADRPAGAAGAGGRGTPVASVPVPGGSVELLAGPDFDADEAGRRIEGERERLRGEIGRLEKKLGNAKFVERAPADVVEGERGKLAEYTAALERL